MVDIIEGILSHLPPAEQVVYLRLWARTHGAGKTTCRARFEDLAREANVSRNTGKGAILKLEKRGLIEITRAPKAPSLFTVHATPITQPLDLGASRVLEILDAEDRSLFLEIKQSIGPARMLQYKEQARSEGTDLDEVILRTTFGPERTKKYLPRLSKKKAF